MNYFKKGQVSAAGGAVAALLTLMIGVGVVILVTILVGVLGGKAVSITESDITAITNTTIRTSINDAIVNAFDALEQTSSYTPLIVLGVVMFVLMGLILGFMMFRGAGTGGGSAL